MKEKEKSAKAGGGLDKLTQHDVELSDGAMGGAI